MINDNKGNIKLCVFGGGRGTNTIIKSLLKYDSIDVTVIINTYDELYPIKIFFVLINKSL